MGQLPLKGVRVADFSQGIAGPLTAMLLGDLGATVWKVEPRRGDWIRSVGRPSGPGLSPIYVAMNRNKQGVCLDMKHPDGLAAAAALAARAEIVVESFRPGVMERFGLGYDALRQERPGLVYCSINGFGRSGPYVDLPATDSIMQALAGVMSINGEAGREPLRFGMFIVDVVTGMNGYQGVLAALLSKAATGEGQHVNVSLLDAIVHFQSPTLMEYLLHGTPPERMGNVNTVLCPSGVFQTRDGYVVVTVLDHHWENFCKVAGCPELAGDPRFASNDLRLQHREALQAALVPVLAARDSEAWMQTLRENRILCAPINDYAKLAADPQVIANGLLLTRRHPWLGDLPLVRHPVRYGAYEPEYAPPPALGEHTMRVLREALGYEEARVEALAASGAIHCANGAPSEGAGAPKA